MNTKAMFHNRINRCGQPFTDIASNRIVSCVISGNTYQFELDSEIKTGMYLKDRDGAELIVTSAFPYMDTYLAVSVSKCNHRIDILKLSDEKYKHGRSQGFEIVYSQIPAHVKFQFADPLHLPGLNVSENILSCTIANFPEIRPSWLVLHQEEHFRVLNVDNNSLPGLQILRTRPFPV